MEASGLGRAHACCSLLGSGTSPECCALVPLWKPVHLCLQEGHHCFFFAKQDFFLKLYNTFILCIEEKCITLSGSYNTLVVNL